MKYEIGTLVRVTSPYSGGDFADGDIVKIKQIGCEDDEECYGAISPHDNTMWFLNEDEVVAVDKAAMNLVWHNCKTCLPEETYNECLFITNGDGVFEVEWDNGYWISHDGCRLRNIEEHCDEFWWADIDQTTAEFFKSIGLFKLTFL